MDYRHISKKTMFMLEGRETIIFLKDPFLDYPKPTEAQLRKKVIGIQLSYESFTEQAFGIEPMARAFGAYPNGIIKKIPNSFKGYTMDNIVILKYGDAKISPQMLLMTKKSGVVGYWDNANLIICATKEYEMLIQSCNDLIQPRKAKFAFRTVGDGTRNLMILPVK